MNTPLCVVVVGLAATFVAVPAAAQTAQCSQAQPVVSGLLEDVSKRLEAARLTNSAAAMRDAADDVQSALVDVRAQLAPCAQMEAAAGNAYAGHAMPGMVPVAPEAPRALEALQAAPSAPAPAAVDSHSGHVMPAQPAARPPASSSAAHPTASPAPALAPTARMPPTSITALKCATPVDPKTAPRMMHQGQMYYFCSEQEREAFVSNPGTPATAPAPGNAPAHAH